MTTRTVSGARPQPRICLAVQGVFIAVMVLAGCGQAQPNVVSVTAGDRAALTACSDAVTVVNEARRTVRLARTGEANSASASARLSDADDALRAIAARTTDIVAAQSLQDLVDSIRAYRAVLPNRRLGGYQDVETDVRGRLAGFRNVCPVGNADFDEGPSGWAATTPATGVGGDSEGRGDGAALLLTNAAADPVDIGVTDAPNWVSRTWPGAYRAGLWARAETGSPTLSLVLTEKREGRVIGSAKESVQLGHGWTFIGVSYRATGRGGLSMSVRAGQVASGSGVSLDDLAIARG